MRQYTTASGSIYRVAGNLVRRNRGDRASKHMPEHGVWYAAEAVFYSSLTHRLVLYWNDGTETVTSPVTEVEWLPSVND